MATSPRLRHMRAAEHALPYRVIFEELFAIGKDDPKLQDQRIVNLAKEAFAPSDKTSGHNGAAQAVKSTCPQPELTAAEAERLLFDRIAEVEHKYEELADSKRKREYKTSAEAELSKLETPLLDLLHRIPRSSLCLSGGGIRSAAYSLGVLQALARFRSGGSGPSYKDPEKASVLEQFDYLSTVSGGGYIGSWLTAWTQRVYQAAVDAKKPISPAEAFHAVTRGVAGDVEHTSGDPARRPIRHLREYTSFLAPKLGLTLDTWTLAALVLRNLLVNWVMIVPVILALVAGLQTVHYGVFDLADFMFRHQSVWWWVAAGFALHTCRYDCRSAHAFLSACGPHAEVRWRHARSPPLHLSPGLREPLCLHVLVESRDRMDCRERGPATTTDACFVHHACQCSHNAPHPRSKGD